MNHKLLLVVSFQVLMLFMLGIFVLFSFGMGPALFIIFALHSVRITFALHFAHVKYFCIAFSGFHGKHGC